MNPGIKDRLADAASQSQWEQAVALLQTCDAPLAAEALGSLPFNQQQTLFRLMPLEIASALVAQFPYYHE